MCSQSVKTQSNSIKWSPAEIMTLIEAYKNEPSLYNFSSDKYYNKRVRNYSLKRIGDAVRFINPIIQDRDCVTKFRALRTQYNKERCKVITSKASGKELDDVYRPTLWYYSSLKFLDPYITPRKEGNFTDGQARSTCNQDSTSSQTILEESFNSVGELTVYIEENELSSSGMSPLVSSHIEAPEKHQDSGVPKVEKNIEPLSMSPHLLGTDAPLSPALSTSSGKSGDCSPRVSTRSRKRNRNDDSNLIEVLELLTDSLKNPVVVPQPNPRDPLESSLAFLGSILRTIKNEDLKFAVIRNLTQTVLNAHKEDIKRSKNI